MHRRLTILLAAVGLLVASGLGFGEIGTNSSAHVADGNGFRPTADEPSFGPVTFSSGFLDGMDVQVDTGHRFEPGAPSSGHGGPTAEFRTKIPICGTGISMARRMASVGAAHSMTAPVR